MVRTIPTVIAIVVLLTLLVDDTPSETVGSRPLEASGERSGLPLAIGTDVSPPPVTQTPPLDALPTVPTLDETELPIFEEPSRSALQSTLRAIGNAYGDVVGAVDAIHAAVPEAARPLMSGTLGPAGALAHAICTEDPACAEGGP